MFMASMTRIIKIHRRIDRCLVTEGENPNDGPLGVYGSFSQAAGPAVREATALSRSLPGRNFGATVARAAAARADGESSGEYQEKPPAVRQSPIGASVALDT
jgi:hypothetical protein